MIPLDRRERALRAPITRRAATLGLTLAFGLLLVGGCLPPGGAL